MSKTISFDFDGVLHSYISGWTGEVPMDDPVTGAKENVNYWMSQGYKCVVHTCRALNETGRLATIEWLRKWGFPDLEVTTVKPFAVLYIDDRAWRFTGKNWPNAIEQPWCHKESKVKFEFTCRCGVKGAVVDKVYVACGHPA